MQIKYFQSAWSDIKNSPGWMGKIFILSLLQLVPIFGQIVRNGYLYGWAREIAWGVNRPMPSSVFENSDGKLYSRGFYVLILAFVFSLVPGVLYSIYAFTSAISTTALHSAVGPVAFVVGAFGLVFLLLYFVAVLIVMFLQWVGAMRIAIYNQLSAGFQLKKIWAMLRHDTSGILRIFGMYLLIGFIASIILGIIFFAILVGFMLTLFTVIAAFSGFDMAYMSSSAVISILGLTMLSIFFVLLFSFVMLIVATWVEVLVVRALGYWTYQFGVASWKGQEDPMPFEVSHSFGANGFAQQYSPGAPYQQPATSAQYPPYQPQPQAESTQTQDKRQP